MSFQLNWGKGVGRGPGELKTSLFALDEKGKQGK